MNTEKIKTNRYSVYKIKSEFQHLDDIVGAGRATIEIPNVGHFVFDDSHVRIPAWVTRFFGNTINGVEKIFCSSAKGVLIVPIVRDDEPIYFAISFGYGRYLLKDGVVEERFGLKVVLNSLDTTSLRSINKTALGSIPKHSQEQMSRNVAAADFGIDIEQDLISAITGESKDKIIGSIITGRDALSGTASIDITNVVGFLSHCLESYESNAYQKDFAWIDQISEVRDRVMVEELNQELIARLRQRDLEKLWMAVPEIIDWASTKGFRYLRGKRGEIYPDLDVVTFLDCCTNTVDIQSLKTGRVYSISALTDDADRHWTVFQCLYVEVELKGSLYILNNGKWYKIAKDFTESVCKDFDSLTRSTIPLPECTVSDEGAYNTSVIDTLPNSCCMDRVLINHGGSHSSVEFCDIYTKERKLIHIKRYGGSNVLSHLFAQGVVSGELLVSDVAFRKKLNDKLPPTHRFSDATARPNATEYEVIYGIISDSDKPLDIPFFSKVSLKNARRRLSTYGYQVSLKQIKRSLQS